MNLGMQGRTAFVAASSQGLGRAIAEALAAEGVRLALCARTERIAVVASEIAATYQVRTVGIVADVSVLQDVSRAVEQASEAFGAIDILVTNAGGPPPGPFESHTSEAWQKAVDLNLMSVVNLCRAVVPGMKERRWGRILNVTSIAVKQPVEGLILSNSVRAAVTGFARTLANEVAPYSITVNNLLPGYTRTERLMKLADNIAATKGITSEAAFAAWEHQIPMGRLGEPAEFAALAAFLASERAGYVTAQNIAVDGGWIKGLV
ncbi:MAG: SDR family oxidoreductase [Gemmatimonadaceae bacterium]